jgi:tRNA pseudouridine38-40 synthase
VLISYLGGSFSGWQRQPGLTSVQETIEKAVAQLTGESTSVVGSGRTDAGVHALGQVAHFVLRKKNWDPSIVQRGLNGILPKTIQIIEAQRVALEFHAQRSALKKQYSYYFQQGPTALPSLEPYSWWIRKSLDLAAMTEGLEILRGEHDFKAFQASGSKPGSTVRTILEAQVIYEPSQNFLPIHQVGMVRVRIVGTGFLKQMVRGIAGTLLQVGEGRRSPQCFQSILDSKDRGQVGPTAPPRALWLEQVWYPDAFQLWQKPVP